MDFGVLLGTLRGGLLGAVGAQSVRNDLTRRLRHGRALPHCIEVAAPMPPTPWVQNLDFGSNICLLGSGRGLKRRGAPIGSILAKFQLQRSHSDPFCDQNHVFVRPVKSWF